MKLGEHLKTADGTIATAHGESIPKVPGRLDVGPCHPRQREARLLRDRPIARPRAAGRPGGRAARINTTSNHLFWDAPLGKSIPANRLTSDEHLKTPDGRSAVIVSDSTPVDHDGWMWDLTVPGNNDHDFYVQAGMSAVLVHNDDGATGCPSGEPAGRGLWQLTRDGASRLMKGGSFNTTFFQSASDGSWWTSDMAGHGGSAFKVFEEGSTGLSWISDADEFGDYIEGKWKGGVGSFIPWSQLCGAQ